MEIVRKIMLYNINSNSIVEHMQFLVYSWPATISFSFMYGTRVGCERKNKSECLNKYNEHTICSHSWIWTLSQ